MGPLNGYTVIELAGIGPAPMGGLRAAMPWESQVRKPPSRRPRPIPQGIPRSPAAGRTGGARASSTDAEIRSPGYSAVSTELTPP